MGGSADLGECNELSFVARADFAPPVDQRGSETGWDPLTQLGRALSGAPAKERRTREALAAADAAKAEADALTRQAAALTPDVVSYATTSSSGLTSQIGAVLTALKSPSATGLPIAAWIVAAGGGVAGWAVAPGRLGVPVGLAALIGLAWWEARSQGVI